jgi:hypothetical protein
MPSTKWILPWSGLVVFGWAGHPLRHVLSAPLHTIAIMPVAVPAGLTDSAAASAAFTTLIVTTLRANGLSVFSPDSTMAMWEHVRDSAGGFYDTYTGKVIEANRQAVLRQFRLALKSEGDAEALLYADIRRVTIRFNGSKAQWSGAEEGSGGFGGASRFLFGKSGGQLVALTLFVQVLDMDGKELYSGEGGIQLTQRIKMDRLVFVPADSILTQRDRNASAVHLALDSLARLGSSNGP